MAVTRSCWEPLGLFLLLFLGISEAIYYQKLTMQKPDRSFLPSEKVLILECPLIGPGMPVHWKSQSQYTDKVSQKIISDQTRIIWQERDYHIRYTGRSSDGYKVGTCTRIPEDATSRTRVEAKSPLSVHAPVSVTCTMQESYPRKTKQVWLKNNKTINPRKANPMLWNLDCACTVQNALEGVRPMPKDRFTCQVVRSAQPPFNASLVLEFRMEPQEMITPSSLEKDRWLLLFNLVLWLGLLLNKTITAIVLLCLILKQLGQPSAKA